MMKKAEEFTPVKVYSDPVHEERTKKELEISRAAMQKILDEWLALELGPCMGLSDLLLRPRTVYDRNINDMIPEVPGPFKMDKTKYRDTVLLPDPSGLYAACTNALRLPYCAMYGLWIVNDIQVEMDETEVERLIDSQSLYASTPDKIEAIETVLQFCDKANKLNGIIGGQLLPPLPYVTQTIRGKFLLKQDFMNSPFLLYPDPDFLRFLIQK